MIEISESARGAIRNLVAERGLDPATALRVFVRRGGCAGLENGMTFELDPRESDSAFEARGARIVVDPSSLAHLEGATIDYLDALMGGGGHSFRTA